MYKYKGQPNNCIAVWCFGWNRNTGEDSREQNGERERAGGGEKEEKEEEIWREIERSSGKERGETPNR